MKFLMYSVSGEGAQILSRIHNEGNEVGLYIDDPIYANVFDGILPKVKNCEDFIDKNTVIIFDISGNGIYADELRRKGHFVYGASSFADNLEHDRNFGFKMMRKAGIQIPPYMEFKSFSDGISYAKEHKERLVFKPNGNMPCKLTYVSDDTEQLIAYLNFVEKRFGKDIDSFILQDFIEGLVISSEIFCSNGEFVWPANHTIEVKKSMNDDLGPSTGCSGNITWNCMSDIVKDGVFKAKSFIREQQYTGQIDLNAVVNEKGVYGLEWTPRFGYDATPTYLRLLKEDFGKFFSDCARGDVSIISHSNDYAASVRLSIPPYPMEAKTGVDTEKVSPNEGIPIQGWEKEQENLYFYEVMLENEQLVHSGGTGVICLGLSEDSNAEKAVEQSYDILEGIKVPDKQYRTDLAKYFKEKVEEFNTYVPD